MLTFYGFGSAFGLPDPSPFVMKSEVQLKMAGVPYRFERAAPHDARSPLMYAAASGSLAMIRLLLDAGADPFQADSKGARPIDYLLGYGPTGANSRLTEEERERAAKWLF